MHFCTFILEHAHHLAGLIGETVMLPRSRRTTAGSEPLVTCSSFVPRGAIG